MSFIIVRFRGNGNCTADAERDGQNLVNGMSLLAKSPNSKHKTSNDDERVFHILQNCHLSADRSSREGATFRHLCTVSRYDEKEKGRGMNADTLSLFPTSSSLEFSECLGQRRKDKPGIWVEQCERSRKIRGVTTLSGGRQIIEVEDLGSLRAIDQTCSDKKEEEEKKIYAVVWGKS